MGSTWSSTVFFFLLCNSIGKVAARLRIPTRFCGLNGDDADSFDFWDIDGGRRSDFSGRGSGTCAGVKNWNSL